MLMLKLHLSWTGTNDEIWNNQHRQEFTDLHTPFTKNQHGLILLQVRLMEEFYTYKTLRSLLTFLMLFLLHITLSKSIKFPNAIMPSFEMKQNKIAICNLVLDINLLSSNTVSLEHSFSKLFLHEKMRKLFLKSWLLCTSLFY